MPTALIVEDEPMANKLLAMLVQLRGYRTESAFNGREALAKVDHEPPDIVFLDLMLPDVNGYEVCRSLKTRKATALIPVVMVTARVAVENRVQSYVLGADRYISKPYTPDQIYEALDEAAAWRRDQGGVPNRGGFRLESRDEGETLRHLARLRSLLLARTPLDGESVATLGTALQWLAESADAWGQTHNIDEVAALDFRTLPDRVELTLRDLDGWLRGDSRPPAERWPEALAPFDQVASDPDAGSITLVKRFPAVGPDTSRE